MRIWSIHPQYLDTKGLLALWRETLLAQKVLQSETKGYRNHPQLIRFKNTSDPLKFIGSYLQSVWQEADRRGYAFDHSKIKQKLTKNSKKKLDVTDGQINYEFQHLLKKIKVRDILRYHKLKNTKRILLNPLFQKVHGEIEDWEII